jgi:hypothetical protein
VATNAPEEEIRRSLTPDVRQALPLAVRAVREALAVPSPHGPEARELVTALGRQIGLLKAGLAAEHKEDWIGLAFAELIGLPFDLVFGALPEVRRRVRFEGDVVPAILESVEPRMSKLQTEQRALEKLEAIAG